MNNIENIRTMIAKGDKEGAIKSLVSLVRQNGDNIEAWLLLGEVIDDPAKKKNCYNQVLKLSPNNSLALDRLRDLEISQLRLDLNSSDTLQNTQPKLQSKPSFKPSQSNALEERVRRSGYEPKPETPFTNSTSKEDWKMAGLVLLGIGGFLGISYVLGIMLTSADSSSDSNPLCTGILCLGLIIGAFAWYSSSKNRWEVASTAIQEQKQTQSSSSNTYSSSPQNNVISCRVCEHTVSRTAPSCPNCGELYPGLISKCPYCGSKNIHITPKGFSLGKAAAGAVIAGPLGVAGGLHGRKDLEVKCSNCHRNITIKHDEI